MAVVAAMRCYEVEPITKMFNTQLRKRFNGAILSGLISLPMLLGGCGEPEDTYPGQPVTHRRAAFKDMLRTFEPMGVMLRTDVYDPQRFAAMLARFMPLRDKPWQYFPAGALYPPSKAKPQVWSEAEKFKALKDEFLVRSDRLNALAGSEDRAAVAAAYTALSDNCKQCHDAFKED